MEKEWKRWKRWARAYLTVQKARGVDEKAVGTLLFTLLDGAALRAFDSVNMDVLEQVGGEEVIYQTLDKRYPEEAVHDFFDFRVERNESKAVYYCLHGQSSGSLLGSRGRA